MKLTTIIFLFTFIFIFNKNLLSADQEIEIVRDTINNILKHGSLVELDEYLKSKKESDQSKQILDDYVSLLLWNVGDMQEDKIREIAQLNLKYGIDINDPEHISMFGISTFDTFWQATEVGNVKCVKNLILLGANINEENHFGTYLMHACRTKNKDKKEDYISIVKLLVANKADLNKQTKNYGYTALRLATIWDQPEIVYLLLDAGAKMDFPGSANFLHYSSDRPEIIKAYKYYLNAKQFRQAIYKTFKKLPKDITNIICNYTIRGSNNNADLNNN